MALALSATSSRSGVNASASGSEPQGLRALFEPRSVAVVGVSQRRRGLGRRVFERLRASGFHGHVFPITQNGDMVDGHPSWTNVRAVPEPVDLAVIAVKRDAVPGVIDDCIAASVKAVVIITAGFAETDRAGEALQTALLAKVRDAGIRMVGPNCMGVINANHLMNASFSPCFPPAGGLAMSSQSGALGLVILDLATKRHVGLSTFVSVGNRADVSGNDLLEYWADDANSRVIALYMESFGNPRRFAQIARRVARQKPIIAVKSGRSVAGAKAAGSHTAALAASDVAVDALFHQTGVIRADTIDEMFDLAASLDTQPLPRGPRVAIVTNAGGPGILAADACSAAGLVVVPFSEHTRARLVTVLPNLANVANPLDMIATAGPDEYCDAVATVLASSEIDALLVLFTAVDASTAAPVIDGIRRGIVRGRKLATDPKPILACIMANQGDARLMAGDEQVPVYAFPENAARALGKIVRYAMWRHTPPRTRRPFSDICRESVRSLCQAVIRARGADWLTQEETARVLAGYGITPVPLVPVRRAADAAGVASVMGYPVVAKLSSRQALHKTDVGGVIVGLQNEAQVRSAFDTLIERARNAKLVDAVVLLQPMVTGGIETMIGVAADASFGSLVGFGSGGVEVEALGDVHFRVTPLDDTDVTELINESRVSRLMAAHRGRPAADVAALSELLARVSRLAEDVPEIVELDLNPVVVLPAGQGCHVVDVRVRVGDATAASGRASQSEAGRVSSATDPTPVLT
jgi:acetate---CoA ligase (ADP-forming)